MNQITIGNNNIQVASGHSISIKNNQIIVNGKVITSNKDTDVLEIHIVGDVDQIDDINGSVHITGNVGGNIVCGGSVRCNDTKGDIDCGGSVKCNDVYGDIDAGGSVKRK